MLLRSGGAERDVATSTSQMLPRFLGIHSVITGRDQKCSMHLAFIFSSSKMARFLLPSNRVVILKSRPLELMLSTSGAEAGKH